MGRWEVQGLPRLQNKFKFSLESLVDPAMREKVKRLGYWHDDSDSKDAYCQT